MSTMYGADVAQLRTLAGQFDRMASQLDSNRMTVGNAIQISAWVGPVAVRFRHTWESDYSRRLHGAAERLRAAARLLRANADDQERTSAASGGSTSAFRDIDWGTAQTVPERLGPSPSPIGAFIQAAMGSPREVFDWMANVNSTIDNLGTLSELYKLHIKTPGITGPLGVMFDTASAVDALNNGDLVGAGLSGVSGAAGVAGMFLKSAHPLGMAISVGKTFVDWTLPYSHQSQDETYAMGLRHLYGRSADPSNVSTDQAAAMSKRYDGLWGVANMISDRMDATADRIFPWNRAK